MNRSLLLILVAAAGGAIAIGAMARETPAEKAGARGPDRFFEMNDANEDGATTKDELAAARKEREGQQGEGDGERMRPEDHRGPPEEGRGQGRRGGGDGEGRERRERPNPEDIFERLDTDGDGSVSFEEFKAGRPEGGPLGGRR